MVTFQMLCQSENLIKINQVTNKVCFLDSGILVIIYRSTTYTRIRVNIIQ